MLLSYIEGLTVLVYILAFLIWFVWGKKRSSATPLPRLPGKHKVQ